MDPELISTERDGFSASWKEAGKGSRRAFIVLFDDTHDGKMDRGVQKWLSKCHGINALALDLTREGSSDTRLSEWPIERIEKAVTWLKKRGMEKIGIIGISMQATLALAAASLIPDITLTVSFAPADYVPWGFHQGPKGKYRKAEWPSGRSAFSHEGRELPYLRAPLEGEDYWKKYLRDRKKYGEIHTTEFFEQAEAMHRMAPEVFIPVENIKGDIVLVGAEDDSMWPSARYIRRMHARLMKKDFRGKVSAFIYEWGTHLLVPERLLYSILPVGGGMIYRMYKSGKKHGPAIRAAREELEDRLGEIFRDWN